jgi:translation elongation factor P/translation initiation factor 5A
MSLNKLKKGDCILFNDEHPCKISTIQKSAPGKHGSAKYSLMGKNLLTDKTHSMLLTHHDNPHFINVSRRTLYCSYFDDNYAYTIDEVGNEESFLITKIDLLEKQNDKKYIDGCDITIMDITYEVNDEEYLHNVVTELHISTE